LLGNQNLFINKKEKLNLIIRKATINIIKRNKIKNNKKNIINDNFINIFKDFLKKRTGFPSMNSNIFSY